MVIDLTRLVTIRRKIRRKTRTRCGRDSHTESNCYAKTTVDGDRLDSSGDDSEEDSEEDSDEGSDHQQHVEHCSNNFIY